MSFKVEKDIPVRGRFTSPFCEALDSLNVEDSIGGLTREEVYKYTPNFYTKYFRDRKFTFGKDPKDITKYRIWRKA